MYLIFQKIYEVVPGDLNDLFEHTACLESQGHSDSS